MTRVIILLQIISHIIQIFDVGLITSTYEYLLSLSAVCFLMFNYVIKQDKETHITYHSCIQPYRVFLGHICWIAVKRQLKALPIELRRLPSLNIWQAASTMFSSFNKQVRLTSEEIPLGVRVSHVKTPWNFRTSSKKCLPRLCAK